MYSFRKQSIPSPWKAIGKFLGGGGLKSQNFRSKVRSLIGISWGRGVGGVGVGLKKRKTFHGGDLYFLELHNSVQCSFVEFSFS